MAPEYLADGLVTLKESVGREGGVSLAGRTAQASMEEDPGARPAFRTLRQVVNTLSKSLETLPEDSGENFEAGDSPS
ncbi:hypothetical protein SUGI_0046310 [Cryptomeria japonica]|nr:hypothetical protein SUGI_0046310 [Cryptomeria japonica]